MGQVQLSAIETATPSILPTGTLWTNNGWVRGTLPIGFWAADPSGICSSRVVVGSASIPGPSAVPQTDTWHQCPDALWQTQVDTRTAYGSDGLGEGQMSLAIAATDAAQNGAWKAKHVYVDNVTPSVTLSGPSQAPAGAGTQYITATATAGPSGVSGISCSVDGSPFTWFSGSTARLPVSGVGIHTASCRAYNNARDASGNVAASPAASATLAIRQPTAMGVWFPGVINPVRCRRVRERITIPAQWVTVRVHGRAVKIHLRSRVVTKREVRCRARVVRKRVVVWTTVTRHGHRYRVRRVRWIRVVLPARSVALHAEHVAFGRKSIVEGWLGTTGFAPLGGQRVTILSAPANGSGAFVPVAAATTTATGAWSAVLPPGPSRVVEAVYGGASLTEPAMSNQITTSVPARVSLRIQPHRTHWGGRIEIRGSLAGGYIPPAGELIVLWIGWSGGSTEIGHLYTDRTGHFASPYTFLRGNGTETYRIWADTARESDYPYAPGASRRVTVTVGQS